MRPSAEADGPDPLELLIWGITGVRPGHQPDLEHRQRPKAKGKGEDAIPQSRHSAPSRKVLTDELDAAYAEREALLCDGADTTAVIARILELRRRIRQGGHLRAGDYLLDRRYKLLEPLKQGGFGTIYRAFATQWQQLVAIKVLHGQHGGDDSRIERFFRGARKMAGLTHPGIVRVLDPKQSNEGHHFFVMEYLPGGDLRDTPLPMPAQRTLDLVLQVGDALVFSHARDLVHHDVKPANIVLDDAGQPKLTDFDLVRAGDTTGGTRTGALGTFCYAAPEMMDHPSERMPFAKPMPFRDAFQDGSDAGPEMVWLPGGTFRMGSPEGVGNENERPAHQVKLGHYAVGKYPVTVGEFRRFVEATGYRTEAEQKNGVWVWNKGNPEQKKDANWRNPYMPQDDRHPVICLSWNDAQAYCDWLGKQTGQTYGLVTEAQWEHACRAGSESAYCFGDDEKHLGDYAWYSGNAGDGTHPVGEKRPNAWGLHDVHGNCWEWCRDWYSESYSEQGASDTKRHSPSTGKSASTTAAHASVLEQTASTLDQHAATTGKSPSGTGADASSARETASGAPVAASGCEREPEWPRVGLPPGSRRRLLVPRRRRLPLGVPRRVRAVGPLRLPRLPPLEDWPSALVPFYPWPARAGARTENRPRDTAPRCHAWGSALRCEQRYWTGIQSST